MGTVLFDRSQGEDGNIALFLGIGNDFLTG